MDIKTAFLHGVLPKDETAYLEQPKGFEEQGKEDWVMELKKSIYGMKQAGRIWNEMFHDSMTTWGFEQMVKDPCMYHRKTTTVVSEARDCPNPDPAPSETTKSPKPGPKAHL